MKSPISPKSIAICFGAVLILYLAGFNGIEYWRHRHGPWEITFLSDPNAQPALVIAQARMNLSDLKIRFPGQSIDRTNLSERVVFDRPLKPLPFGKRLHEDLVYLPGVETFEVLGHVIELFPRALKIDGNEVAWEAGKTIDL